MKRYNQIRILILCFLIFMGSSCKKDFFELTNPPEFPWQNINQLEMAAVTPYNLTFSSGWGSYWQGHELIFDCMADYIYLLPNTSADIPYSEMYYRTTTVRIGGSNGEAGAFGDIYKTIGACNSALDFYAANNNIPFQNPTENDLANLDRIKGELHFMKAFAYFIAAKNYAPSPASPDFTTLKILPLRATFPKNIEDANQIEFGTAKQIYDIVVSELTHAMELLPDQFIAGVHHPSYQYGRANKIAAYFLMMRVKFLLGDSEGALQAADQVINSGYYKLDQDPLEAFSHSDPKQGNEVIFYALYYDDVLGSIAKVFTSMNKSHYTAVNGGRGDSWSRCSWDQFCMSHTASKYLGWMDENLNVTDEAKKDKRYDQLYYRLEGNNGDPLADPKIYETQYVHIKQPYIWGDKYYRGPNGRYTNVPVMRLAEAYLTRSILRFKNGDVPGALNDLNRIRVRAGLDALTTLTEEDINKERLKELAFEGDYFFYLEALRKPIGIGDRVGSSVIEPPYTGVYWPIPQLELDMNNPNSK